METKPPPTTDSEVLRRSRMEHLRQRAHQSIERMMVSLDMARFAVTFAVLMEPNRDLRRLKSREAQQHLAQRGRLQRWLLRAQQ